MNYILVVFSGRLAVWTFNGVATVDFECFEDRGVRAWKWPLEPSDIHKTKRIYTRHVFELFPIRNIAINWRDRPT